jgi:hypothetical protein
VDLRPSRVRNALLMQNINLKAYGGAAVEGRRLELQGGADADRTSVSDSE